VKRALNSRFTPHVSRSQFDGDQHACYNRAAASCLCIRAGYLALRRIADFFGISYEPNPRPTDPISIAREEFDVESQRSNAKTQRRKATRSLPLRLCAFALKRNIFSK
jgi:hypothetical protein